MMPSKKKKYNARFPPGRIKKIMQTDEDVGKVAQAVPVIISRALELFVESLLTKTMEITSARNAKTLSPSHMKHCIFSESRFDFLKDLVKSLPDMAGEGDECFNSTPSARTTKLSSEVPSSVEKEKEYSVEGRVPQGVKDPPNSCLRVGECYKTYGNISRSNVKNSPNYDSDSSDQLPLSNHLETMASGDNSLPQPPVTNYYSVAKHGDASVVPPNNFKERGLSVANPVDNSDVLPVKQTTLTFGENVQPTTSSVTLDEDYDA